MRTPRSARAVTLAAVSLLLAAGCAGEESGGGGEPGAGDGFSYSGDEMVLRVEYTGGGFPVPGATLTPLPAITIYGDGRVITEGPQLLVYPGPALPNLLVRQISPTDAAALADRALDTGVGTGFDFGHPGITDQAATRFTVLTQVGPQSSEVYALEYTNDDAALTEEQRTAREQLRELLAALSDLPGALGADAVGEETPYQPTAVAAVAKPWEVDDPHLSGQPELPWPGPELPGEPLDADLGLHCVTVTGADTSTLLAAAAEANQLTPWVSGGERWQVTFRPLLPGETGCSDLRR